MTVTSNTYNITYILDETETEFDFNFPIDKEEDIELVLTDTVNETFTTISSNDYTVHLNPNSQTGWVEWGDAVDYDDTYTLTITRITPITQDRSFTNVGKLYLQRIEKALDKITMILQEWFATFATLNNYPLSDRINKYLYIDEDGTIIPAAIGEFQSPVSAFGEELVTQESVSTALTQLTFSTFSKTLPPLIDDAAYRSALNVPSTSEALTVTAITPLLIALENGATITQTSTTADFTVAAFSVVSDDGTTIITLGSNMAKDPDTVWAAGNSNGCLDTGTITADSTYVIYAISKDAGADPDILISKVPGSVTLPATYTKKAKIGWLVTQSGSANRLLMVKRKQYWYIAQGSYNTEAFNTSPPASATALTLAAVPPNCIAILHIKMTNTTENTNAVYYIASNNTYPIIPRDDVASLTLRSETGDTNVTSGVFYIPVNASKQVYHYGTNASNVTVTMLGFIDTF